MQIKESMLHLIGFGMAILALSSCTMQLHPMEKRSEIIPHNPHLLFESDSISNFIVYQGFVVCLDSSKRVPAYTVHRIKPKQLSESNGFKAKRSDEFWIDKRINNYSASREDYYKSGYDRGHHVPAGDFVADQSLKDETFTYANVSPQLKQLNRFGWKYLEVAVRRRVKRCNCEAYVVTGTLFDKGYQSIGKHQVGVPSALYKIILYPQKGKMHAFLMENSTAWYAGKLKNYQLTVDELEQLSGYDFFENLNDEDEHKLEGQIKKL